MDKRLIYLVPLLVMLSASLYGGQLGIESEIVQLYGHFGGSCVAAAYVPPYVLLGEGCSLRMVDAKDLSRPRSTGKIVFTRNVEDLVSAAGRVYVALGIAGISVVDYTMPSQLMEVGKVEGQESRALLLDGNYLYSVGQFLKVYELETPEQLKEVGSLNLVTEGRGMALQDGYLYIAAEGGGLHIVDVNDPLHPSSVSVTGLGGMARNVAVHETLAYVACQQAGLNVVDVADREHPQVIGTFMNSEPIYDVVIRKPFLVVANGKLGVRVLNVSNPANPFEVSSLPTPGLACGLHVQEGELIICNGSGASLASVSVGGEAAKLSDFIFPGEGIYQVSFAGNRAYVANGDYGLVLMSVRNAALPEGMLQFPTGTHLEAVGVSSGGSWLFFAHAGGMTWYFVRTDEETASLQLVPYHTYSEAGNPHAIKIVSSCYLCDADPPEECCTKFAIIANRLEGLCLATLPRQPPPERCSVSAVYASYPTRQSCWNVWPTGVDTIYGVDWQGVSRFQWSFSCQDSTFHCSEANFYPTSDIGSDVFVGSYVYFTDSWGVHLLNPGDLGYVSGFALPNVMAAMPMGNHILLAAWDSLVILDATDIQHMSIKEQILLPGGISRIYSQAGYMYVVSRDSGIFIFGPLETPPPGPCDIKCQSDRWHYLTAEPTAKHLDTWQDALPTSDSFYIGLKAPEEESYNYFALWSSYLDNPDDLVPCTAEQLYCISWTLSRLFEGAEPPSYPPPSVRLRAGLSTQKLFAFTRLYPVEEREIPWFPSFAVHRLYFESPIEAAGMYLAFSAIDWTNDFRAPTAGEIILNEVRVETLDQSWSSKFMGDEDQVNLVRRFKWNFASAPGYEPCQKLYEFDGTEYTLLSGLESEMHYGSWHSSESSLHLYADVLYRVNFHLSSTSSQYAPDIRLRVQTKDYGYASYLYLVSSEAENILAEGPFNLYAELPGSGVKDCFLSFEMIDLYPDKGGWVSLNKCYASYSLYEP